MVKSKGEYKIRLLKTSLSCRLYSVRRELKAWKSVGFSSHCPNDYFKSPLPTDNKFLDLGQVSYNLYTFH